MLKYTEYDIVFTEIPDETTLAINLSNCPYHCKGCHTPELQENVGKRFDMKVVERLLKKYPNTTCLCFMGGDKTAHEVWLMAYTVKEVHGIKTAWYSGRKELEDAYQNASFLSAFDYIKLGPYVEELGALNNPNTNQRLYKINGEQFVDITEKF